MNNIVVGQVYKRHLCTFNETIYFTILEVELNRYKCTFTDGSGANEWRTINKYNDIVSRSELCPLRNSPLWKVIHYQELHND